MVPKPTCSGVRAPSIAGADHQHELSMLVLALVSHNRDEVRVESDFTRSTMVATSVVS